MATASGTTTALGKGRIQVQWTLTSSATVGRPATIGAYPDKTYSARGTFGGATVTILGSNQSATVAQGSLATQALNDTRGEGNAMTFSSAGNILQGLENPNLIWPRITTLGTGTGKSIIVTVHASSTRR
jgi:hypothetical protein